MLSTVAFSKSTLTFNENIILQISLDCIYVIYSLFKFDKKQTIKYFFIINSYNKTC